MIRIALFMASAAISLPAFAQSHHHHGQQGPTATRPSTACTPEHAAMGHCTVEAAPLVPPPPRKSAPTCTAEHAAMGHCTVEPSTAPAQSPTPQHAPACTPEHAAMGHCTLPSNEQNSSSSNATGTNLPAGNAPAPPVPTDWYADRYFPKAEMEHARHLMMAENGAQTFAFLSINTAEIRPMRGHNGYRWSGEAWWGGDINRLTVKSEGEGRFGSPIDHLEVQALYSRAIGPYFNAQAGIRQDLGHGPRRSYAALGIEGLAPFWFEVEGTLFLSDKGDLLGRLEAYYDQRITQRLILQPRAEANFSLQDIPAQRIGKGLSDYELGTRLRYEIAREFAPYIGVEWHRKIGKTAQFSFLNGNNRSEVSIIIGIKLWL